MERPERRRNTLVLAALTLTALYLLPYGRLVLLPVVYLDTHLHELSHALAAWLTGGSVARIVVASDGSGYTLTSGGITPVVASAGYLGASALGAGMILLARHEGGARAVLAGLGVAVGLSLALLVRGDVVGVGSGILWTGLLLLAARRLRGDPLVGAAQFLGIAQGLQALAALSDLLRLSFVPSANSDAQAMAALTGIPALLWALLWAAISLALTGSAVARAYRHRLLPPGTPPPGG